MTSPILRLFGPDGSRGRTEPLDLDFGGSVYRFRILPGDAVVPDDGVSHYRCDGQILSVEPIAVTRDGDSPASTHFPAVWPA